MQRRYDIYGFQNSSLEEAATLVEQTLGVRLTLRDSSYRGIYYCAGSGATNDYFLQTNGEEARWHSRYPEYKLTLAVNDLPDMDRIKEKLTARGGGEPTFLHSIIQTADED